MAELIVEKLDVADAALDRARKQRKQIDESALYAYQIPEATKSKQGKQCPPQIRQTLLECLQQLDSVCDGAKKKDGMGFNRFWTRPGRQLAQQSDLNEWEARIALKIVSYHKKQLGIDVSTLQW